MDYATTRLCIWLPPAFFLGLAAIVALAARHPGTRAFYVVFSFAAGYWLLRSLRVGVEVTSDAVAIRGSLHTRHYPLSVVVRARVEPMHTSSPVARFFPYVALALDLDPGGARQFGDMSVRERDRVVLDRTAEAINGAVSSQP